jgi:hypothetical protein
VIRTILSQRGRVPQVAAASESDDSYLQQLSDRGNQTLPGKAVNSQMKKENQDSIDGFTDFSTPILADTQGKEVFSISFSIED